MVQIPFDKGHYFFTAEHTEIAGCGLSHAGQHVLVCLGNREGKRDPYFEVWLYLICRFLHCFSYLVLVEFVMYIVNILFPQMRKVRWLFVQVCPYITDAVHCLGTQVWESCVSLFE